jgi:nitrate reductase cytochrome c-type subunit
MKIFIFALIALVAAGAAVFHHYPGKVESILGRTPLKELVETSKPVYQWRDENGQWHVTDKPPAQGIPYEVKQYALDANVLPAFKGEDD